MNWRWQIAQAAEIRWWKNYLRSKTPEDYLRQKEAYWQRVLRKLELPIKPSDLLLDAGCGPAGIFIHFRENPVDAVDPLLEQYAAQLPHFQPSAYPNTRFIAQPLEQWIPERKYDYVFCLNAINHVADLQKSLDHVCAALKPDGQLIISVDAHNYSFFKFVFQQIPGDILHPHQYDLQEYKQMILKRGFELKQESCLKQNFFFNYYILVLQATSNHF